MAIADAVRGILPLLLDTASTFGNPPLLPTIPTLRGGGEGVRAAVGVSQATFSSSSSLALPPPVGHNTEHEVTTALTWHPNQEEEDGGGASTAGAVPAPFFGGGSSVNGRCNGGILHRGGGFDGGDVDKVRKRITGYLAPHCRTRYTFKSAPHSLSSHKRFSRGAVTLAGGRGMFRLYNLNCAQAENRYGIMCTWYVATPSRGSYIVYTPLPSLEVAKVDQYAASWTLSSTSNTQERPLHERLLK